MRKATTPTGELFTVPGMTRELFTAVIKTNDWAGDKQRTGAQYGPGSDRWLTHEARRSHLIKVIQHHFCASCKLDIDLFPYSDQFVLMAWLAYRKMVVSEKAKAREWCGFKRAGTKKR